MVVNDNSREFIKLTDGTKCRNLNKKVFVVNKATLEIREVRAVEAATLKNTHYSFSKFMDAEFSARSRDNYADKNRLLEEIIFLEDRLSKLRLMYETF